MNVYAFDVDHTLDCSGGHVPCAALLELRKQGHVVGICGNFAVAFGRVPDLVHVVNFFGQMEMTKAAFLRQIKAFVPADAYVMVGNDRRIFGESMDIEAAEEAGWQFVREHDFRLQAEQTQYFPDGNGWSKIGGHFTAKGDKLYWEDGSVTENHWPQTCFTALHEVLNASWKGSGIDYSQRPTA